MTRISIDPVTRVEGHGKITLIQEDDGHISEARLHIVEFRGFEKFIQGRPYWEVPVLVQRLCGICPVSHHLAAAKATDMLVGAIDIPPTALNMRRLMHFGQILQSHALHFFHLASPDLLFGYDDEIRHRNIVGVLQDYPDLAKQGVLLRKFGQQVIEATAGKRIHGTGAIPGGINKALNSRDRERLLAQATQIIEWAQAAVGLIKSIFDRDPDHHRKFATITSSMLSLVDSDGNLEFYDGYLRAEDESGSRLIDDASAVDYLDYLREHVEDWSYMKFPFIRNLGLQDGWYRVGPLARLNNCNAISTPLAEQERVVFMSAGDGKPVQSTLAIHWARLIELLHCAESIQRLLGDDSLTTGDLSVRGQVQHKGVGVIEAPRGTLIHHYEIDDDGLIERANLIVSTTHNNRAMNESIRQVAENYLDGRELTEPLLNQLEVAVRAYDPCLSCATHALGQMPMEVELLDSRHQTVQRLRKSRPDEYGK